MKIYFLQSNGDHYSTFFPYYLIQEKAEQEAIRRAKEGRPTTVLEAELTPVAKFESSPATVTRVPL